MEQIIEKLSEQSKKPNYVVTNLVKTIKENLIKEGCEETDPRFLQYLVRRAKKRLKIEESVLLKTFKEYFKEK